MPTSLYHSGTELFQKFRVNVESEITFTDYCKVLLFPYKHAIKFTPRALLFQYPPYEHDDWFTVETIEIVPWENVHCIENVRGRRVWKRTNAKTLQEWLSTLSNPTVEYPFLQARLGHIALMLEGVPRSERSRGGKRRMRQIAENISPIIRESNPSLTSGPVQMRIEIFSTEPSALPDVDRLSSGILDAFEGIVYENDKQVTELRPRVINTKDAFAILRCQTNPMEHFTVQNMPVAALYPLATGLRDYYVIRISS